MVTNRIIFFATSVQPNPEEIDYWVDLSDNPYGGSIKYFNGTEWVRLAASGGTPDLSNYYTKIQVNKLLNDKANIGDVDSKVDDEEVKDVIKDIQFNTSNPNGITMVMFKYDGSNKTVSIPVASTSSAGIITSKDFLDFVKQHQLQELHTEMIDTFADIRAKYQKKLIAGLNIEIDQETNVISASGDLAVQWDNITNKPDFKPVATSGDYNDLINKLKPGKDVSISEDNVISIAIDSDSLEQSLATLQSNIDKEAATARAAETKLGNDIATEKNRAQSAEQTISTNLQNEIDRSTQIDTQHTNVINKEVQDRKEAIATEVSDRNAAILVETNRAKAKEEELDNKITDHTAATNAALALKADKSDTYTKAQVDAKLSGAYKVKGSSTFETLPKDNNVVGDVYNITNAFNLGGKHYDAGTNVVWTEEGWDALSGSFDTTAIEGSIQEVADNLAQEILDRTQAIATEVSDRNAAILVETNRAKAKEEELDNKITDHTAATNAALALKADKSDTYTKAQVDAKLSGAYKVKGSSTFETLPKDNNVVGDVYNITNAFNLGGKHYDAGTNVVWTEEGWDALSGSFDTTAIEGSIQEVADNLAQEILDRTQAITTAIANEVERATGVEETLNSNITQLQTQKVDKVEGKGLSTNDYTTPEKNKLAAIEAEANKYVLPAATASALGGVKIGSNITLADGGTISITKNNVTSALGVDPTTTYVRKAGDTMTGILNIKNSEGAQLELFSTASNSGAYMRFYPNNQTDNKWYLGVGTNQTLNLGYNTVTKASFGDGQLSLTTSANLAPIKTNSTTLCTNLNADMVDGVDVKDIEHTLYIQSTTKNYLKIQVNHKYFPNSYKIVEYYDGYIYVYQLLINAHSPEFTDLQLISGKVHTGIKTFYDLTKWYIETTESGMNIYIYQPENSNFKIYGVIHGEPQSPNVQFSVVSSLPSSVVSRHITFNVTSQNLEEFDWYGVSWSETSSNPDCTRIGNMDMHRTLPIQSMMKGYIYFKDGNPLYRMLKLNDSWTKCENHSAGGWRDVSTLLEDNNVNVMIKIPEFWWIDDYVESTETHNLKICPHAKPGWHHHKEAYVSAYEGYIDGNYYRSSKNKIPSVNFTRSTVRPKARANGLGNSWNIYTYNEHRAICHLFLVEYATRNSQKAVNTELTPEGFRQGGLGSGCTRGTATINGAQIWSFIPTGSSDSLGSGSGEVTVTIQQTDSSGSNTTTTTRKCNRYRGIENPFGHVWKHTDDVISVYISGYGARFWYKCDSPDHFGDSISNDNPYYKNIAANAVATGYKTKIVTTSTCDFFALSFNNGSETTYWCDYNWDNTDGSLHCLLIGGYSDAGGLAGLFALNSSSGVGDSYASIGSRLTYLPWAE